jgi:hypothetical protein
MPCDLTDFHKVDLETDQNVPSLTEPPAGPNADMYDTEEQQDVHEGDPQAEISVSEEVILFVHK